MVDKWGNPFIYPSDINNEFFWQLSSNPNEDRFFRPDEEVEDNGDGSFSFASTEGLRPSLVRDTSWDRIGCDVPQSQFASRGYGNDAKLDFRDIEFKWWVKLSGGTSDKFMSPEMVTGRHSTEPCNEGSSYGFNFDYNVNPLRVRPFKEQYHSEYTHLEWKTRTDILNAKVAGLGRFVGFGINRYNKQSATGVKTVVIEAWVNPDPTANPKNWQLWTSVEDKGGWGDRGLVAGAPNRDQILHWAMPVGFRIKIQDGNLNLDFKNASLRRIDPFAVTIPDNPTPNVQFGISELRLRRHINTERFSACTIGSAGFANFMTQTLQNGDTDMQLTGYKTGEKVMNTASKLYNVIIKDGTVYLRKTGTVTNDTFIRIRRGTDNSIARTLATIAAGSIGTSETAIPFTDSGNTYRMAVNDEFSIEHDGSSSNYVSVFRQSDDVFDGANSQRFKRDPGLEVNSGYDLKAIINGTI